MEDPTTKRHQPRNYLETLEERVALLDGILQQVRPDLAGGHLSHGDFYGAEILSSPSISTQFINNEPGNRSNKVRAHEEHDGVSDLASQVGMLGLNAAGAEPHYLGSSSAFAFSRVISSSLLQGVPTTPKETFGRNQDNTSTQFPCLLPDYEAGVTLSDAYFQNIHPQYPFLHEATFRVWEAELTGPSETSTTRDPVPLFFLYMVRDVLTPCGTKS